MPAKVLTSWLLRNIILTACLVWCQAFSYYIENILSNFWYTFAMP